MAKYCIFVYLISLALRNTPCMEKDSSVFLLVRPTQLLFIIPLLLVYCILCGRWVWKMVFFRYHYLLTMTIRSFIYSMRCEEYKLWMSPKSSDGNEQRREKYQNLYPSWKGMYIFIYRYIDIDIDIKLISCISLLYFFFYWSDMSFGIPRTFRPYQANFMQRMSLLYIRI